MLYVNRIKEEYPPEMWGYKMGYICGVLEKNGIITEPEGDKLLDEINDQMISTFIERKKGMNT